MGREIDNTHFVSKQGNKCTARNDACHQPALAHSKSEEWVVLVAAAAAHILLFILASRSERLSAEGPFPFLPQDRLPFEYKILLLRIYQYLYSSRTLSGFGSIASERVRHVYDKQNRSFCIARNHSNDPGFIPQRRRISTHVL